MLVLVGAWLDWTARSHVSQKPLATADLGDGRILRVEAVTYGVDHRVGNHVSKLFWRLNAWLPKQLQLLFAPRNPEDVIDNLDYPALVVWVNAINATTRTNVDCQSIRVELVDEYGQDFEEQGSYWFGGLRFWRVGHLFQVFPRRETNLTMLATNMKNHKTSQLKFPNPYVAQSADCSAMDLPQQKQAGDLSIVLTGLRLRTNGVEAKYWETRTVYWEPMWELRRGNKKIDGWDDPEWFAEDPAGNRGQQLGTNQPVLRYSARFYPSATNIQAAQPLAVLPKSIVTNLQSPLWWKKTVPYADHDISVLGLFPAGSYVFRLGVLLTNPPVPMGPVSGGAPTGWTTTTIAINPLNVVFYHGYYSLTNSVIFVSARKLPRKTRLAVRLRDGQGGLWAAEPEPQGAVDGIYPFLVNLPPSINQVTPELVLLKAVEAEFTAKVPSPAIR
ncbi:MAG TPA: hypothetical protein VH595_05025 [Verrucomicrobiae bacterium]|nr:hypothetical protein [Verrucomicrobiae bacterium]